MLSSGAGLDMGTIGSFARLIMVEGMRDHNPSPASTAMMEIPIRNILRALRQFVPDGNFDLLKNPMAAPPFLTGFLSR